MKKFALIIAAASFLAVSAHAEDKPALTTFDFTKPITQLNGKSFTTVDDVTAEEKPVVAALLARGFTVGKPTETTIATIAEAVLLADFRDEQVDYLEKSKRFNLATAISHDPKKVILNAQQIAMLEKLIGKGYPPLYIGQVMQVIDPNGLSN